MKVATPLLVLLLTLISATGGSAKKKRSAGNEPGSKHAVDEVLCEACKALSVEIGPKVQKLEKKYGKEGAVDEVMDSFCGDFNNYRTYNQIPPNMQKGCYKVLERKHDNLRELFMASMEGREIWERVCRDAFCGAISFDAERQGPNVVMDNSNPKEEL